MRFEATAVADALLVDLEPREDERGFFARAFAVDEFRSQGIAFEPVQANLSYTRRAGTVRGLHYQVAPATEQKLIRCIRGAIFQVAVDVRPGSPTYLRHVGVRLDADSRRALYVPGGCAAGAQALTDAAEAFYLVSAAYSPDHERGIRFDDPVFAIAWPLEPTIVSVKDRAWPDFDPDREASR